MAAAADLPVLPGAEGFGITTPAGRGGQILTVTSLADSGPGTLRAAIAVPGPRVIVFEIAGTITLASHLYVSQPFLTIAGQTAPSPGITLRGAGLSIVTNDVLVQHLRIRVGDEPGGVPPQNRDGLQVLGPAYNVVVDHVSVSWGIDENASLWYSPHDVTLRHCLLSEALHNSIHPEGAHSDGLLIGQDSLNVALIGNVLAHNYDRNPYIKDGASVLLANNLVYNWRGGSGRGAALGSSDTTPTAILTSFAGNVYIRGANTPSSGAAIGVTSGIDLGTKLYKTDTLAVGVGEYKTASSIDPLVPTAPIWTSPLTVRSSSQVESWALDRVGARPADRDAVDTRVISQLRLRQGQIIDSQTEVGGWPELPVVTRTLTLPASPNADDDADGYTNLEEWLHLLAAEVEGQPTTSPTASLTVNPESTTAGQSALLTWTTSGATSVSIAPVPGSVAASGSQSVNPFITTTYTLTASNSIGTTTSTATLTVEPGANQPPVLNPIGDKSATVGQLLTFGISASDPESQPLIYSTSPLPAGAALNGLTFSWTPDGTQQGPHTVTFTVSDGLDSDSETITINVASAPTGITVSGRVLTNAGQPLAGVVVKIGNIGSYPGGSAIQTTTDAQGLFVLPNMQTASKIVSAVNTCQSGGSCSTLTGKLTARLSNWVIKDPAGDKTTKLLFDSANLVNYTGLELTATPD
jgi:hypothetical protein